MTPLPCSRCKATDQRLACIRSGYRHQRSAFEYRCIDVTGCAEREAALPPVPRRTREQIAADRVALKAEWAAKRAAAGVA